MATMVESKQFVFQLQGVWNATCSCGVKETAKTQQEANEKSLTHKSTHEKVDNSTLSNARVEYLDAFAALDHVGSGMKDRLRRFHAAWANLNILKRRNGDVTVEATKPK